MCLTPASLWWPLQHRDIDIQNGPDWRALSQGQGKEGAHELITMLHVVEWYLWYLLLISNFGISGGKGRSSMLTVTDDEHQRKHEHIGPGTWDDGRVG